MATQKVLTSYEAAGVLDFDVDNAALDALAVGAVAWCKPETHASPCHPQIEIFFSIKTCTTAQTAAGFVEFYVLRGDDHASEIRTAAYLGTLSDHGVCTTAALVAQLRASVPTDHVFGTTVTADIVYTGRFIIDDPGPDWQLAIYNGMDHTFNATANQSAVHWRTVTPDIGAAA